MPKLPFRRALVFGLLALWGCVGSPSTPTPGGSSDVTATTASTGPSAVVPSGGGFVPGASPSPLASTIPVGGQSSPDPAAHLEVDLASLSVTAVTATPATMSLNVPPQRPDLGHAGFVTRRPIDARVVLSNGMLLDGDLVWSSSNPEAVMVITEGTTYWATTVGGAWPPAAPVVLTGTSRKAPSFKVTVRVTVLDEAAAIVELE